MGIEPGRLPTDVTLAKITLVILTLVLIRDLLIEFKEGRRELMSLLSEIGVGC